MEKVKEEMEEKEIEWEGEEHFEEKVEDHVGSRRGNMVRWRLLRRWR